jgi:hypothetical protein
LQTIDHPTAVFRARQEPVHVAMHFPIGSIIDAPTTRRELAPQPVPQSAFDGVGKDPARVIRPVTNLAFSEWLGVMAWPFKLLKIEPIRPALGGPFQSMTPFAERVNVDMPPQGTLGTQTSIIGAVQTTPDLIYAKLGAVS